MSVANRKPCPGYPPYGCTTLIDPAKALCQFCSRTKQLEDQRTNDQQLEAVQSRVVVAQVQRVDAKRTEFLRRAEIIQRNRALADVTPKAIYNEDAVAPPPARAVERPVFGQPADTWHPTVEVIEILEPELVPSCPCGGMRDGLDHEKSLLHKQYLLAQTLDQERPTAHYRTHWPKGANQ